MIIAGGEYLHSTILIVFNKIMQSGQYPVDWQTNIILPIFKSGNSADPSNYRGIALSSCLGKLFTYIINSRIEKYLTDKNLISIYQNGFKRGHRTEDNIVILKSLFNKYVNNMNQKLYVVFVDFRKFFDLINRDILCYKMQRMGITGNVYDLIKSMYGSCRFKINCGDGLSESILSNIGLKQGCNISPNLSNIVQNDIHDVFGNSCDPVCLGEKEFSSLSWADDLVLISLSESGLQNALDALSNYCHTWSICINAEKTVCMTLSKRKSKLKRNFSIKGKYLKHSDSVKYLGFHLTHNLDAKAMINDRIAKANRAVYVLRQALSSSGSNNIIDIKLATSLFDKLVSPVLLYGCCVWGLSNPTNQVYLKNVNEGGNTRLTASKELSKCGKLIDIVSARRVGRINERQPRDILINIRNFDDKLYLLYSNTDSSIKKNLSNFDLKLDDQLYETVHTKFMKVILGASKYTSNTAVFGELGRFPIAIKTLSLGVKYWHTMASGSSPNKLLHEAFKSECRISSMWIQNIKYLLLVNGLGNFWLDPISVSSPLICKTIRKRLEDQFVQKWFERAKSSVSLHTLNKLKCEYVCSAYLNQVKSPNMRRIYSKLRLNYGILNYSKINDSSANVCKLCDSGSIENITHFLCECPILKHERQTFSSKLMFHLPAFKHFSNDDKISLILNLDMSNVKFYHPSGIDEQCIDIIMSYVKSIFNVRNSLQ
jgi:hypothetical protein